MAHGSVGGLDDEGLLLALAPQLLDVVLELGVLGREDPGLGDEGVLLWLALDHPAQGETSAGTGGRTRGSSEGVSWRAVLQGGGDGRVNGEDTLDALRFVLLHKSYTFADWKTRLAHGVLRGYYLALAVNHSPCIYSSDLAVSSLPVCTSKVAMRAVT